MCMQRHWNHLTELGHLTTSEKTFWSSCTSHSLVKVYSRIFAIAAMYTCFSFWFTLKAYQMPSRYGEIIVWSWRKVIITSFPLSISCLEENTSFCYRPHHTYTLPILSATTANIFPFLFHFKPSELHVAGTSPTRPDAQSPIPPGREHLRGCGIHSSSGQPWAVITSCTGMMCINEILTHDEWLIISVLCSHQTLLCYW